MDSVRGGQSGASALRCAAVHLNSTNQRRRGPGCLVPELKGEVKFSEPGVTSKVETVVCGTPAGNKPQSGLGQDALIKGRRPGGRPLNKGVIQLLTSGDCVGVATYSAARSCDSSDHEEPAKLAEGKNGSTPRRDRDAVRVRVE